MTLAEQTVMEFDDDQLAAQETCLDISKRVVGVSGPAGSGKTTIIRNIYEALVRKGYSVALAAPTGKAARRIKEATGINAQTIHKLLEYSKPGDRDEKTGEPLTETAPKRDRFNKLEYSVVIVDEYAMVNTELHNNLIAALPSGGVIRAFGDLNQLNPIEKKVGSEVIDGRKTQRDDRSPFRKIIEGDDKASVTLTNIYRQGEGSTILEAANKIRKGHRPPMLRDDAGEFVIKFSDNPVKSLKEALLNWKASDNPDPALDFTSLRNQIIMPQRKGRIGTTTVNLMMQQILNPTPTMSMALLRYRWDSRNPVTVGIGDKVVCNENTYDFRDYHERYTGFKNDDITPLPHSFIPTPETKMMLNGEVGIVTDITPDGGLEVDFGDRIVEIPGSFEEYNAIANAMYNVYPTMRIDLAYALTTHKCQGSEFDHILYILNNSNFFTQNRKNFYTAVTRARKKAIILTDQRALQHSVSKVG